MVLNIWGQWCGPCRGEAPALQQVYEKSKDRGLRFVYASGIVMIHNEFEMGKDGKPIGPEALAPVFPMNLIEQEVSRKRWIRIPEPIMEILKLWRPSPLYRAKRLEAALKRAAG